MNTCDICDGVLITKCSGGEIPYLVQRTGHAITGPAYTVEFAPKSDPRPPVTPHYIDHVPPGSVLVIATSCPLPTAPYTEISQSLYGGLMSRRAQQLGAKGSVVLGNIRDLDEHRQLKYPVFSYGVGCCPANEVAKVVAVNNPLDAGFGQTVNPGDIVVADENGVVVVPADKYETVIENAKLRMKANETTAEAIDKGEPCQLAQKRYRQQYA